MFVPSHLDEKTPAANRPIRAAPDDIIAVCVKKSLRQPLSQRHLISLGRSMKRGIKTPARFNRSKLRPSVFDLA